MQRFDLSVSTDTRDAMVEITGRVLQCVRDADFDQGTVLIYVPHTTAGVTINENADPDVVRDVLGRLDEMVPHTRPEDRHAEGNSAAHVKASMMGSSCTVLFNNQTLILGRWQGIYLCEFDGPRQRSVTVFVQGQRDPD